MSSLKLKEISLQPNLESRHGEKLQALKESRTDQQMERVLNKGSFFLF